MGLLNKASVEMSLEDIMIKMRKTVASIKSDKLVKQDIEATGKLSIFANLLNDTLEKVKELPKTAERASLITGVEKTYNRTVSALDLASQEELTLDEANTFLMQANKNVSRVQNIYASVQKQHQEQAGMMLMREADKDARILKIIEDSGPDIQNYAKYASDLPQTSVDTKRSFIVAKVPVITVTDPVITAGEWAKAGFVSKSVGFYPVVENQLVIGINSNKVKESGMKPDEYRQMILEAVQHKLNTKLTPVSNIALGFRSSGFTYMWVMTERDMDRLRNVTHKAFVPKSWGFAFK